MSEYCWLTGDNNSGWAIAAAPPSCDELELWDLIESLDVAECWPTLQLSFTEGTISDFPPCNVLTGLCSQRLVELLHPIVRDSVMWLPVVVARDGEEFKYHYMHLPERRDVLNEEKSIYAGGRLLTPHISLEKAEGHPVIGLDKPPASVIVRSDVREALQQSDCTGMAFENVQSS